jgi:ATP-dependent RNA helicase DeaD
LEKKVGKPFEHKQVPNGQEVCEKQLFSLIDKVEWVEVDESTIEGYLDVIYKKLAWLPREELIKRFVSVEFNRFLAYYKDAVDLNISAQKTREAREKRKSRESSMNFSRFHINLGSKNKVSVIDLISLINKYTGNQSIEIGKIEILNNFSFFEIDKSHEQEIIQAFKNVTRDGLKIKVEVSKSKGKPEGEESFSRSRGSDKPRGSKGRSDWKRKGDGKPDWKKSKSKGKRKFRN